VIIVFHSDFIYPVVQQRYNVHIIVGYISIGRCESLSNVIVTLGIFCIIFAFLIGDTLSSLVDLFFVIAVIAVDVVATGLPIDVVVLY